MKFKFLLRTDFKKHEELVPFLLNSLGLDFIQVLSQFDLTAGDWNRWESPAVGV